MQQKFGHHVNHKLKMCLYRSKTYDVEASFALAIFDIAVMTDDAEASFVLRDSK